MEYGTLWFIFDANIDPKVIDKCNGYFNMPVSFILGKFPDPNIDEIEVEKVEMLVLI